MSLTRGDPPSAYRRKPDSAGRILILGGSGYVGGALLDRLGPERTAATYSSRPVSGAVHFDALAMDLADVVDDPESFSHAVILYADKTPEACIADPVRSHALNVDSVRRVLKRLREWGVKPVFASTEFVFEGSRGGYVETDLARPVVLYGRQKLEAEGLVEESFDDYLIVRLAKIFGSQPGDGTLFTRWKEAIARGETIRCATDQVFAPVHIDDVVEAIVRLIDRKLSGVFHVSSGQPASRLEFLEMLIAELEKTESVTPHVVPCGLHELGLKENWPLNASLHPAKLVAATGMKPINIGDACRDIARASSRTAS